MSFICLFVPTPSLFIPSFVLFSSFCVSEIPDALCHIHRILSPQNDQLPSFYQLKACFMWRRYTSSVWVHRLQWAKSTSLLKSVLCSLLSLPNLGPEPSTCSPEEGQKNKNSNKLSLRGSLSHSCTVKRRTHTDLKMQLKCIQHILNIFSSRLSIISTNQYYMEDRSSADSFWAFSNVVFKPQ